MRTIGITGGIGSGKTELLAYIRKHYCCRIIGADAAAHKLEEPGAPCHLQLTKLLGREILKEDGRICKKTMAERIFADETLLKQVNAIMHPAVKTYILEELEKERKAGKYDFFFVEAALLIEEQYGTILDELWYIHTEESVRRERLRQSRGYSEDKITQIMKGQLPEQHFFRTCDTVIDNSESLESAYRQIDEKLGGYL